LLPFILSLTDVIDQCRERKQVEHAASEAVSMHVQGTHSLNHRIAASLAAFSLVCGLAAFSGWIFAWPKVRGFGFAEFPIWPWTAVGFVFLSIGFLASNRGYRRVATAAWLVPLAIASLAMAEMWLLADLGMDQLLFPKQLMLYHYPHQGRPGVNPTTVMLMLSVAGLGANTRRLSTEARNLMATLALGIATAAAILVLFSRPGIRTVPLFSISLPGAIMSVSLAFAIILQNSGLGWIRELLRDRANRRVIRILLPAALLLPLLPALLELIVVQQDILSPIAGRLLVVLCNVLVVVIVAYWAVTRVAREQAALIELSQALDVTIVALTTPDGRVVHWSKGAAQLFGWSAEEALGQHKYALLRSRCQSSDRVRPRKLQGDAQELVETTRDGRDIAVLERVDLLEIPGREPLLVLGMTDVSDRARAVADLRESEDRLAIATATHDVGVFEWNAATGKINWTAGAEQRLGLVPGSITDFDSWRAMVEQEDAEEIQRTLEQAVGTRAPRFSFRYRFVEPNGTVRAVEGSSRIFYDSRGRLKRTVGAMLDVTEREQREAALRKREAQLRSIVETVPEAMLVLDDEGIIHEFSSAAERLWGYHAEDVLGQRFTKLVPPGERVSSRTQLVQFLSRQRAGTPSGMIPATSQARDGRRFPVEIRAGVAPVDGRALYTLFVRDLTESLAQEERLSELNAELAHVGRQTAMSELAADMAHELNQPLAATSNFLAAARMLTEKGEDSQRIADMLRMANDQTLRAGEIIRRLRSFTMRGEVDLRDTPLEPTIRDAVELVLVGQAQFHIEIVYDLDEEVPSVFADRVQVQQVLVNLLRNSVDVLRQQTGANRRIIISSRKFSEDMAAIEIADSGPGIPEAVLGQLFSRFTTTKREGGGMGIGLSISKRIIEAHGGSLTAENGPEGGAVFRFTLPTVEQGGV
jgi:two-component system, LuxR family, sensor kinase FixL